ncbi:winged helix-turn-helix domain-containing protein [Rhodococcus sp. IEGM 1330]|uniref:winged helix-turn-helix domain-containing protein n=1 Tax=Rhodococcus sp. IEGM 1330 TaxID=3082225 RepID=UPI00295334DB|nr:winged helix-turn-helix domain-containing protein [Rhodococcus sp. IEGM 1330]MDV8023963.1 winged helix-turn-helix domain-containing protein [Rhodococcus sp. IEGM 1330]
MIFTVAVARAIADGTVRRVYRRWSSARVTAGSVQRSSSGMIRIDSVHEVDPAGLTDADARAAGEESRSHLEKSFFGPSSLPTYLIEVSYLGTDPRDVLADDAELDETALNALRTTLSRMDSRSESAWTRAVLTAIAAEPGRRAADLAEQVGLDTKAFKARVRRLKNLGLTISLETGYRLSPRGTAFLRLTDNAVD